MATKTITLTIGGEFTVLDLASLLCFIRGLDRDNRTRTVTIQDKEGSTLAEAEALMREVLPDVPGRRTTVTTHRRQ